MCLISGVLLAQEREKPNIVDNELCNSIAEFVHLPYLSVVEVRYRKDGYKICHWELLKILEVSVSNLKQFSVIRDIWYVPNYWNY